MLGTQMIAKGLDYPNVTLVGVISGDTALALPDFRCGGADVSVDHAGGRPGRPRRRGRAGGAADVLAAGPGDRGGDPPGLRGICPRGIWRIAGRWICRHFRHGADGAARSGAGQAARNRRGAGGAIRRRRWPGRRTSQSPADALAIQRIAGYWRHQILLQAPTAGPLQAVLAAVRDKGHLARGEHAGGGCRSGFLAVSAKTMCGRYRLMKLNLLLHQFPWITGLPGDQPQRDNIAPTQQVLVISSSEPDKQYAN